MAKNGRKRLPVYGPKPKPKARKARRKRNGGQSASSTVAGFAGNRANTVIVPKSGMKMDLHRAVCASTDPFCIHARGHQLPDGGPPTIPFQLRQLITLGAAGTSGRARTYIVAGGGKYTQLTVAYNGGTSLWDNAAALTAANQTFPTTYMREVRIVSFGAIVRSAMTATTSKGSVILSVTPRPVVGAASDPLGSMTATDAVVMPLAAGMEYSWRSKPLAGSGKLFRDAATITTTMTDFDWTSLCIEVVGSDITDSIPYLTIEYIMNIEFTMSTTDSAGLAQIQQTPPKPSKMAVAAADIVHATAPSFIQGGITKATNAMEGYAMKAMSSLASEGLAFLTML